MTNQMDDLAQEPMAWMSPGKERLEFSRKDTVYGSHTVPLYTAEQMREAIKQAVLDEREACAKVCDELHWPWHMGDNSGPKECAEDIRARSQA